MSVFVQGEPGVNGTAGAPGVPGEDGAIGPKVRSRNNRTFAIPLTSSRSYQYLVAKVTHLLFLQGESGSPGVRGPEGAPGRGIPGDKVIDYTWSYCLTSYWGKSV